MANSRRHRVLKSLDSPQFLRTPPNHLVRNEGAVGSVYFDSVWIESTN
jgi:hypothetical protein